MSRIDTIARRHADAVLEEAKRGEIPRFQDRPQSPRTWFQTWPARVAVGVVLTSVILISAGVVRPNDVGGPARSNGLIIRSLEANPAAVAPDGTPSDDLVIPYENLGEFVSMTWATDGRRLALIGMQGPLRVLDALSGELLVEVELDADCPCDLDWSPDETTIVIADARGRIRLIETAGWEPGPEVPIEARAFGPSWSPDSQWIAFTYYGDAGSGLAKVRPDGSDLTVLHEGVFGSFEWSPNSHQIAGLVSTPIVEGALETALSLVTVNDDGSRFETVADLGVCACLGATPGFTWSPDGTLIALNVPGPDVREATGSTGDWGLFLIEPDGTGFVKISTFTSGDPAWQPLP